MTRLPDVGHRFADPSLLEQALTHRSASGSRNNERLEFLGDAVLNFLVGELLFHRFPAAPEGQLTRARARLVNEESLAGIARALGLGNHLRLGPGEMKSGTWRRNSVLADCTEAILGAVLLDAGPEACRACIAAWYREPLASLRIDAVVKDPKTRLQEFLQGRALPLPRYEVLETTGDDHARRFRVACESGETGCRAEAWGDSRRHAEQAAAEAVLAQLGEGGR